MELRHLRYFVAVAEELNFTRAAVRLRVAQPALSSQIKDLEAELQTRLFERQPRGVQLTAGGKALYQRARSILGAAAEAAHEARTAAGLISGRLVLGFPSGIHLNYLVPVLDQFRREHPKVEFEFRHGLAREQLKALKEGRIDIAFVLLPAPVQEFVSCVVWRVPFKVVLPARHAWARRGSFELRDLRGQDFVFTTREARPEFYDEFFRLCTNTGFRPRIAQEVGGYPTNILGLVSAGAGISVLPYFDKVERIGGIVWRNLTHPKLWLDSALVWRKQPSPTVEQFIAMTSNRLPMPAEPGRAEF